MSASPMLALLERCPSWHALRAELVHAETFDEAAIVAAIEQRALHAWRSPLTPLGAAAIAIHGWATDLGHAFARLQDRSAACRRVGLGTSDTPEVFARRSRAIAAARALADEAPTLIPGTRSAA